MREEEKKQSSRKIGIQRFFKKRWVYPAVYIIAAAIILTSFIWFASRGNNPDQLGVDKNPDRTGDSVEVTNPLENFKWPVANKDEVTIVTPFYDESASEEEQQAALLSYDNSFQPNTGIAIAKESGETFDVLAAMSGTVKEVEQDAVLGNYIVIEHDDGIVTRYQSVKDIKVAVGDKVKQGDVIAKAGQSLINEDAGVHVHFEIRKNDVPVNPVDYFEKSLATLKSANVDSSDVTDNEDADDDQSNENADENEETNNEDANDTNAS